MLYSMFSFRRKKQRNDTIFTFG